MVRHLPVSVVVMLRRVGAGRRGGGGPVGNAGAREVAGVLVVTMALTAVGGAAVSVLMGAPGPVDQVSMVVPEFAGMRTVLRTVWPPALAVLGTLPVLVARSGGRSPIEAQASAPGSAAIAVIVPRPGAVWSGRWVGPVPRGDPPLVAAGHGVGQPHRAAERAAPPGRRPTTTMTRTDA